MGWDAIDSCFDLDPELSEGLSAQVHVIAARPSPSSLSHRPAAITGGEPGAYSDT